MVKINEVRYWAHRRGREREINITMFMSEQNTGYSLLEGLSAYGQSRRHCWSVQDMAFITVPLLHVLPNLWTCLGMCFANIAVTLQAATRHFGKYKPSCLMPQRFYKLSTMHIPIVSRQRTVVPIPIIL